MPPSRSATRPCAASSSDNVPPFGYAPSATTTMLNFAPQLVALAQPFGDQRDVERDLWDQNRVGAAGDARVQRNPPGVAPHHLDDQDPLVRFGRRVQPIDRVGRERDRGIEPETVRRADDVVVDRLRHADDRHPHPAELVRDGQRAVAADRDQRIQVQAADRSRGRGRRTGTAPSEVCTSKVTGLPVLSVPRMVPPSRRMPVTSRGVSRRERSISRRPSKLSSIPTV